jgi:O-antigen ligase
MPSLTILLIVWGVLTTILVILLIYRSTLTMHEDDQLFLDDAETHMQQEQVENTRRMDRLVPYVRIFGAASALLIVLIGAKWIYDGLMRVQ